MNGILTQTGSTAVPDGVFVMNTTPAYRGRLQHDVAMGQYCSWRTGGRVRQMYTPQDVEDLGTFLSALPEDETLLWIGLGSNLLVRDGGFDGTVITVAGILDRAEIVASGRVRVEAGVPCPKVARFCTHAALAGAEFLVGIPGTMGGALAMNAGAVGGETWDIVAEVETIDRRGRRHVRDRDQFDIDYRSVSFDREEWFLAAVLQLPADADGMAGQKMRDCLKRRAETQPMGQASCGSVFRNPPDDYAARLIEASGLKGYCIGDACVSEKHANFIVNRGQASATDIEQLIKHVQARVSDSYDVALRTEVCIVGNP